MYQATSLRAADSSRWKGRIVSTGVHSLLLLAGFMPFLSFDPPEKPSQEALVLQFEYPYNAYIKPEKFVDNQTGETEQMIGESAKMSGSEAGGSPMDDTEAAKSRPQMAAPATLASTSTPVSAVTTVKSTLTSSIGEINVPAPKIKKQEAWASVSDNVPTESDGVKEMNFNWIGTIKGTGTAPGKGNGDGTDDTEITADGCRTLG